MQESFHKSVPTASITDLISIIMPAYNASKYIAESINCVLNQTYNNWELIITNDGSTDNTSEIVKDFKLNDDRIKLIEQKNKKQAGARNAGLKIVKGTWVAFLDADDLWSDDKLEKQLYAANKFNCDVIYTGGITLYQGTNHSKPYPIITGLNEGRYVYEKLYETNFIPNLAVMMKTAWIEKIGYQNEDKDIVGCEDWDYWIRLSRAGATFYGLSDSLFVYRFHDQGMSRANDKMLLAEFTTFFINIDKSLLPEKYFIERLVPYGQKLVLQFIKDNNRYSAKKIGNMLISLKPSLLNIIYFLNIHLRSSYNSLFFCIKWYHILYNKIT